MKEETKTCPACGGACTTLVLDFSTGMPTFPPCTTCHGSGKVRK